MSTIARLSITQATDFLFSEARALDEQRWDDWLDMFAENATYWVPAWKSENETTTDPSREISLIYYCGKSNLADRIWRLRSGTSIASHPLRRTAHILSNVQLVETGDETIEIRSNCATHQFDPRSKTQHVFFAHYTHRLQEVGGKMLIVRKKIVLLNDFIPAVTDIYLL